MFMNDWAPGIAGGALIGFGAALLLWSVGRIAGISGIASGALEGARGDRAWRIAFLAGMMIAGAAALLVGFGTRLGSGCTSGHGVCGLARFSKRSLAAVVAFMAFAMAATFVMNHVHLSP